MPYATLWRMRRDRTYIRSEFHEPTLLAELCRAYERGWQPADVLHVVARSGELTDVSLAATAVLFDAHRSRAAHRAPVEWTRQLAAITSLHPDLADVAATHTELASCLLRACAHVTRSQVDGLTFTLKYLPTLTVLVPPPSRWPLHGSPATPASADPRILERIRALLDKAESTDFPDEAEALTTKAQELVSRHSVDIALVAESRRTIFGRRVHLDSPYTKEKVLLLTAIGDANRVRTVWFTRVQMATIVGDVVDLDQVELLFASLLVQSSRAMRTADTAGRRGSSVVAFRRAFLTGFAHRIGERLREADVRATADAATDARIPMTTLVPILAQRSAEVDAEFRRLFPTTRGARSGDIDADGFHAGRGAAETASLTTEHRGVAP